jgi:hypothetical protein
MINITAGGAGRGGGRSVKCGMVTDCSFIRLLRSYTGQEASVPCNQSNSHHLMCSPVFNCVQLCSAIVQQCLAVFSCVRQ